MKLTTEHKKELMIQAMNVRVKTVELIYHGKGGHIGGDLSEIDILTVLFDYMKHDSGDPDCPERDHFILSKGHSAEAYYSILEEYGYIDRQDLDEFGSFRAKLGGHPNKKIKGVEANTGSLGHGLGLATGMALALKLNQCNNRIFVLTGDGELAEGSNWEAAMSASKFKLKNLTWIIDRNHLQISGLTEDVMPLENLEQKTKAFGFHTLVVNGHDLEEIYEALDTQDAAGKPMCIIANTTKGKGLACAENKAEWHHKTPTLEQVEQMKKNMAEYRKEFA